METDMNALKRALLATFILTLLLPLSAYADSGFFAGASIGSAGLNEDFDGLNIDTDATAFRIVGGWRFNEYFALEAGYHDFGDFEQQIDVNGTPVIASLSADGFTFAAAGILPVSERFSLTGRLCMFFWNGNAEIKSVSLASPEDSNFFFGAGVSYSLTDSFAFTGDFTRYDLEEAQSNVYSMGFLYSFGN